ncbi:MAG: dihydropyrimidinase [Anaerolineaceae bacterium]|nr:dihydropyrimidinase [Anaerolineaceae bacterium]
MQFELVIHNGTLVTAVDTFQADIGISAGVIAAIGQNLSGNELLDASGKLVLPGAIDPHVHLEMPAGAITSSDDWETGTIAAACGGVTSVVDFIEPEPNQSLMQAYEARCAQADGRAVVDYGLHMTLSRADQETLAQVPGIVAAGMPSFKMYTTYEGLRLNDEELLAAMLAVKAAGGIVMVHAENNAIIEHKKQEFIKAGQNSPHFHPLSRPAAAEAEAIQRALALAETSGVPIYIVHVSTGRGAQAIKAARERGQVAIGETCPQYLVLTDAEYDRPGFEGAKFVCSPPLRKSSDNSALWNALGQGDLQTVGTDHCPFMFKGQKDLGIEQFTKIPNGIPGIETRLALLYSFGVSKGAVSLNQWVQLCCSTPARIFGLYPQKGTLAVGSDADLVIFDPQKKVTISHDMLHEHVDYTPYEGLEACGYPEITIAGGRVLVRDGQFVGPKGKGHFLIGKAPVL